jgi:tryptophan halogenase
MDAALFGQWLKNNICIPAGMTYYSDECSEFVRDSNTGELDYIKTEKSGNLKADLFIDCTGFRSLLLEQTMGSEFYSFKPYGLKNDRAVATIIPYIDKEKEMESVTNCTAIDNGWVWNIPLWNRIGTGYVYSSDYATEQEAEEQFRKHLASNRMVCQDADRAKNAQFRHIKIRHGCHKHAWIKNVLGVGLSNGFIEPLESTGLLLTHFTITKMIAALQMREGHITCLDIDMFNNAVFTEVNTFKDFVAQHYALSNRDDTQYWKDAKNNTQYSEHLRDGIKDPWSTYNGMSNSIYINRDINQDIGGILYIFAGMGYNPETKQHMNYVGHTAVEEFCKEVAKNHWEERKAATLAKIAKLPSHYQFLEENIYNKDA